MPIIFLADYPVQNQNDANHVIGPYDISISSDSKFLCRRMIAMLSIRDVFAQYICLVRSPKLYWGQSSVWPVYAV